MLTELTFRALACHSIRQNLFYTIVPFPKRSEIKPLSTGSAFGAREKNLTGEELAL